MRNALRGALSELEKKALAGPGIRERKHFDPAVKRALVGPNGELAAAKLLVTEHFAGIGSVDVVLSNPPVLLELKWSYNETRSKIFESVWDAIKLALLAAKHQRFGYLATGASLKAWKESESADLFEHGFVCPREMWARPLIPRGPNRGNTVGHDLILGSPTRSQPLAAPDRLSITPIDRIEVRGHYQVRVVRVAVDGEMQPW